MHSQKSKYCHGSQGAGTHEMSRLNHNLCVESAPVTIGILTVNQDNWSDFPFISWSVTGDLLCLFTGYSGTLLPSDGPLSLTLKNDKGSFLMGKLPIAVSSNHWIPDLCCIPRTHRGTYIKCDTVAAAWRPSEFPRDTFMISFFVSRKFPHPYKLCHVLCGIFLHSPDPSFLFSLPFLWLGNSPLSISLYSWYIYILSRSVGAMQAIIATVIALK